jgi:hypothetical protein
VPPNYEIQLTARARNGGAPQLISVLDGHRA